MLTLFMILFFVFFDYLFINISIGPIHITLLRIVIFISFINIIRKRNIVQIEPRNIIIKRIFLFFIFWFLYGVLELVWTVNVMESIRELYYLALYIIIIFIIINKIDSLKKAEIFEKILWMFTNIIILIAIYEFITGHHLEVSRYIIESRFEFTDVSRATSIFYNENDLSFYINLFSPIYIINTFNKENPVKIRIINLIFLLMAGSIIILNDSKFSFIALVLQLLIYIYIKNKRNFKKNIVYFSIFSLIILIFNMNIIKGFIDGFKQVIYSYGSGNIRINLILNGLHRSISSFFMGAGPSAYRNSSPYSYTTKGISDAHNWWIELLVNYGIIIVIGFIIILYIAFKKSLKMIKSKNIIIKNISLFVVISIVGFMIGSSGPSSIFSFFPFWLWLGIIISYLNILYKFNDIN